MEFSVKSGQPEKQRTACLVTGVFDSRKMTAMTEVLDKSSEGFISQLLRRGDMEGKLGQTLVLHNLPGAMADRVLLVGCGKEREFNESNFKTAIKKALHALSDTGAMEATFFLTELPVKNLDAYWKIRLALEACTTDLYNFDELKSKKDTPRRELKKIQFIVESRRELTEAEQALTDGLALSSGMTLCKDLANMPPNLCTPTYLAEQALALASEFSDIHTKVLDKPEIEKLKMGSFLAVAKGSDEPPKFIVMEYKQGKTQKPICLVGKGITFDTGGSSLKSPTNMIGMKYDMCGAATVLGVMKAVAILKLPINLIGIVPTCENMPGAKAQRPDDIVTSMSGTTIEVLNTDAEGRLILCDALTYCERFEPEAVIDIATLTGACVVALGRHASGLMSNHPPLAHELLNAGTKTGDRAWQMPLWDEYHEQLNSNVADICNIGGPEAGSITAASFLSHFTKKYHWAHLDVAGTACQYNEKNRQASGRPVPLLLQYIIEHTQKQK